MKFHMIFYKSVKVFINGNWIGIAKNPEELYFSLKDKKYKGIINIYTSIIFNYKDLEIRICNDAGRLTRPLFKIKNNKSLITKELFEKIKNNKLKWEELILQNDNESIIEYIDPDEQNSSLIAFNLNNNDMYHS